MTLQNKTYIVTGASSGIGQQTCRTLAAQGASIVLMSRNEDALKQTLDSMAAPTVGEHLIECCDFSRPETIQPTFGQIADKLQRPIDGLVYCAGIGGNSRISNLTTEMLHAQMTVNFYSFVECTRQLVKGKRKADEMRIIGISSLASTTYSKYFAAYSASKAAMDAAVRTLSTELLKKSVHIFSIQAAFVDTPMNAGMEAVSGSFDQYLRETEKQPMGLLPVETVTDFIHYLLASPATPYMTGTNIQMPGGSPC